ncbi:MAG: M1 family aminopeptidase [Ginsengibacter sp.]
MFKTFFLSELRYVLKQPSIYIFLGIITLLVFGAAASDNVIIGGTVGNVYRNAPSVITTYTLILSIFGLLIAAAFYNNAALRDYNNDFNEILFTAPISKAGYFFGRFTGALILSTIPMLGVFLGIYLASILAPTFGWIEADRYGKFFLKTFINNYFLFILPNMFFAGTIIFAMANKWKSSVVSFVGALLIIMAYIVAGTLMSDMENEKMAALSDTFGIRSYAIYSKYYTTIEKNTLSPGFNGLILWNRLIWIGTGFIILLISYFNFSFKEKIKKVKKVKAVNEIKPVSFSLPSFHPAFTKRTEWIQFKSFFLINFRSILKSVTFKIIFLFSAIILFSNFIGGFAYFGLKTYPVTYHMVDIINSSSSIFVVIILVFFSGELVWRDREIRINEVIDATPHTSFLPLAAKAISLVAAASLIYIFSILCGIVYQLFNGFTRIELDVYFLEFLYSNLPNFIVLSGVLIFIQVLLNNKYLGYFVSIILLFVFQLILSIFYIQSNMLMIGEGPSIEYSDMNAFGPGLTGALWFNLYWLLFAGICLLLASALWNRGMLSSLKEKIRKSKKQLPRNYRPILIAVSILWLLTAGFVYYNTQVLNTYKSSKQLDEEAVKYEKNYKKYENALLPKITDAKYFVDIFPEKRNVEVRAKIQLTNKEILPIDSIHFIVNDKWTTKIIIPGSRLVFTNKNIGYLIYALDKPMQPGEIINAEIQTSFHSKGFENSAGNTNIVENGTFLNNAEILPSIGYNSDLELSDKNKRKKYGLGIKERMPALEENCTTSCTKNYITGGLSDYINVETIISTSGDQIAVAPGSLVKKWVQNGRNYYHYKLDHPSLNFYSFISARFEVAKRKWKDVDIEVYYDKKNKVNVNRMLDAVQHSLEYYTTNFGPYYHKQCRIIEFPRYASFAQAFPGTMPYSEAIGFIINLENENDNNIVDAVIAHEMAHQWWAHQVIGANMQGATMLSESFAEYSSLMTMKSLSKDPMKMRQFLKYDYDRYLRGRSTEEDKELPLYKVENQTYIHYGKGSVIMYAMQDYIGEDKMNAALRNFLEGYRYKTPYPTSLDFLKYLEPQMPDSLKYLVTDWFKEITLYDNRMKDATYEKLKDGKYLINLTISSEKIKADTIGNETRVSTNDWIDIGLFADADEKKLIFQKRVKVDKPQMSFQFEVNSLPAKAAIDPRMLLIDRVFEDNSKTVTLKEKK